MVPSMQFVSRHVCSALLPFLFLGDRKLDIYSCKKRKSTNYFVSKKLLGTAQENLAVGCKELVLERVAVRLVQNRCEVWARMSSAFAFGHSSKCQVFTDLLLSVSFPTNNLLSKAPLSFVCTYPRLENPQRHQRIITEESVLSFRIPLAFWRTESRKGVVMHDYNGGACTF
jgi:hypothetical protein